jgi:ribosomal protein S25
MNKRYTSKYSNGKLVSAAQYITEIICEKKARLEKKDLHFRFWTNKQWATFYKNQIASANALLKNYSETAVIRALTSQKSSKIYSLRAPSLINTIKEQQKLWESEKEKEVKTVNIARHTNNIGKNQKQKSNILDKLKDIDNGS